MSYSVFSKIMENMRNDRDIKLVSTEKRRNYLMSEPSYQTTKFFTENVVGYMNEKSSNTHK